MSIKITISDTGDEMKKAFQKEINVTHKTGHVGIKVYNTKSVQCHWHDEFEFILPISGSCKCIVNSKQLVLEQGQALLVFPGELHSAISSGEKFNAVVFHPNVIAGDEFRQYVYPNMDYCRLYDRKDSKCRDIVDILYRICDVYNVKCDGFELMLKGLLLQMTGFIFKNGLYGSVKNETVKSDVFYEIIDFINSHIEEKLTLDYVACHVNVSRSYISRLFRLNAGCSFCDYVTDARVENAKKRILSTNDSILDIALKCGFENVSYFDKIFKQKTGVTPLKYRRCRDL